MAANGASVAMSGLNGGNRGEWRAGSFGGSYDRRVTRSRYFDRYTGFRQGAQITIAIASGDTPSIAACDLYEGRVDASPAIEVVLDPVTYICAFLTADGQRVGEMMIGAEIAADLSARSERRGDLDLGGRQYSVRSLHEFENVQVPSGTPLAYLIKRDGRAIGAVTLDGAPSLVEAVYIDDKDKMALSLASVALALMVDPATY
ncbi:hypothetical protein E3U23_07090 [Erythrobacter litoralis]|uniref:hypothetical protein n=1 Tax=Erythrobacter litoralis TaxID=39960 RepID=UPI00243513C7|nr:hypothetical protein [Erythrobacter litoralis]MDG6078955.1 hypothetical protein [Erythrobacter litoralis]